MKPHFLFPASPLNPKMIDEAFQDQAIALKQAGFGTSVVSFENDYRITGPVPDGATVVFRGWMMTEEEYATLWGVLYGYGWKPLTSIVQYVAAHHLPNWYHLISKWTPNTEIFPLNKPLFQRGLKEAAVPIEEFIRSMQGVHGLTGYGDEWKKFQLKDYVKSLKTAGGSVITKTEEIIPAMENMEKYRGQIEGGICVRAWEDFLPKSELRYFVINGKYFGQERMFDLRHMSLLEIVSRDIPSPFYSVDIAMRMDGVARIVEIGDGQVSDLVGWTPERFAEIWKEVSQ